MSVFIYCNPPNDLRSKKAFIPYQDFSLMSMN